MAGVTLLLAPDSLAGILKLLQGDDIPEHLRKAIYSAIYAARRPTVTWSSPRPGLHIVNGTELHTDLVGLEAAFCAIGAPGRRVVRAADFVAPGSMHLDIALRAALRRAAAFLAPVHAGLAAAVESIKVEHGFAVYRPGGAIDVETTPPVDHVAEAARMPSIIFTRRAGMADHLSFKPAFAGRFCGPRVRVSR